MPTQPKPKRQRLNLVHVKLFAHDCPAKLLNDSRYLVSLLSKAARAASLKVVASKAHEFPVQGVTAFVLLAESHIAIHTWPEGRFATVELFACNGRYANRAVKVLKDGLEGKRFTVKQETSRKWLPAPRKPGRP